MEFSGKIIQVLPIEGGTSKKTGNAWKKIQFVVEQMNTQYPKKALFEVFGEDKFTKMPLVTGNTVNVQFDVEASEYNGRWYNKLSAWRVVLANESQPEPAEVLQPPVQPSAPSQGDLPF